MSNERAEELIRKYLEGTATPEEESLLESWYISTAQSQLTVAGELDHAKVGAEILESLRAEQRGPSKPAQERRERPVTRERERAVRLWPRIAAAAAVVVVLAAGSIFVFQKPPTAVVAEKQPVKYDLPPAAVRATLTLLDGRTIPMDSSESTQTIQQGDETVKSVSGQLTYSINQPQSPSPAHVVAYNTLTTGPGEHYSLLLADGSKVWLNAASSITYPILFDGNERKVKASGELYFEIVHNAKQPFRIAVKDQVVEDMGTGFDISAYDDEPAARTTLLEGSIKVMRGSRSATLTPGQQALIGPNDSSFQIKKVDGEGAIAWKNGYFYFDRADIKSVMRELARWYNVKVEYKGEISKRTFKGKLYRNINAAEALQILTYFGAHFTIDGRTITVSS